MHELPVTTPCPSVHQDNLRKDGRNVFATMAVFSGIASWVPLVIVVAFPLTIVCALLALATSRLRGYRHGLSAAWVGTLLALAALALHVSIAALVGIFGFIGDFIAPSS